jgi:chemosensory pili system protein ChpA (sensor histidine kinase/response regulator)
MSLPPDRSPSAGPATMPGLAGHIPVVGSPRSEAASYFAAEAAEHLEVMTACLRGLHQGDHTADDLVALFRAVHTLKGAAYVVGFAAVGDLAHRLEDVLAAVRMGPLTLTPGVVETLEVGVEALRDLLEAGGAPGADVSRTVDAAVAGLDSLMATEEGLAPESTKAGIPAPGRVGVDPAGSSARPGKERDGERLEALLSLVGELVTARTRLDHHLGQLERAGELLAISRARMAKAVADFEAREPMRRAGWSDPLRASFRSEDAGGMDYTGRRQPVAGQSFRTARFPAAGDPTGLAGALPATELFAELELDRYDDSDLLGRRSLEIAADLSVVQSQLAGLRRLLAQDAGQVQRVTASLRRELMRARLVAIRSLFARVARQIRDLARADGKVVAAVVSGEAVEVDRLVVEKMADPILHLVRNAIAHGIEGPDEREALGKPPRGTVSLTASHRGASVYIEVKDDGRGIDPERLKEQAVRQGLLPIEMAEILDASEALDLIFLPGLSTAPTVTAAAGRGVGMDAVRASVGALDGEITVETDPGLGTRFTIRLPLMLTASDALLVRVGAERLAIPLNIVKGVLEVAPSGIRAVGSEERIRVGDRLLELIHLGRILGLTTSDVTGPMPAVLIGGATDVVAVAVSELLGKEEIVLRGLGELLTGIGPYAGATVSAEGRPILVLDPIRLRDVARTIDSPAGRAAAPPDPQPADPEPPCVLLVDDSISVRKFVGHMLERAGFSVRVAGDGAEALAILQETTAAMVITDLEMPRVNGFELIQRLRQDPATRDLPVVVLTTRVGAKHLQLARWLGVTDYVAKPVDEAAFVRQVGLLAPSARSRPAPAVPTADAIT